MTAKQGPLLTPYGRSFLIGVGIYALSLMLRLAVLGELKDLPTVKECTVLDMRGNHEFALAILQGLRPTTYYKAPFYSYFLAGVYAITGSDPLYPRIVQTILTSLTPVLTFLVAQSLFGRHAGIVAGVISSFFWTFLYYSIELLDTGLACLFQTSLAYLLLVLDDRRPGKWFLCGLFIGLGAITRPNIVFFAPVLVVMIMVVLLRKRSCAPGSNTAPAIAHSSDPSRRPALKSVIALTVGCCLPIAPVTLRNRLVGGEWVLLGAYGGMNMYVANSPYSDSKNGPLLVEDCNFVEPTTWDPNEPWARCCLNYYTAYRTAETKLGRPPKPGEFGSVMNRMAWEFLREHPRWLISHAARRLCWMFNAFEFPSNRNLYDFRGYSRVLTVASMLQFGVICPLALLGLGVALSRSEHRTAGLAYQLALLASLVVPAALFHINVRFRVPIVHVLMPFAAFGLLEMLRLFRPGVAWGKRLAYGVMLGVLAVFSNANWFDYRDARGAHLQWAMVMACEKAGREDMLPKVVENFERAVAEFGDTTYPSDTSLVMKYSRPKTWLFRYYNRRDNTVKAKAYAHLMIKDEPLDPIAGVEALGMFIKIGDRKGARETIEALETGVGKRVSPEVAADCLAAYGRRFADTTALNRAVGLYEQALRLDPGELRLHRALTETREFLHNAVRVTSSRPATTSAAGR